MPSQLGPTIDARLNAISRLIGDKEEAIARNQAEFDELWREVFSIFDEFNLEGERARFIADDGSYLYRQMRNASPVLHEDELLALLNEEQREAIMTKKVSPLMLESAIQSGLIPRELVNGCITTGDPTPVRKRGKWTSADKRKASLMDIEAS